MLDISNQGAMKSMAMWESLAQRQSFIRTYLFSQSNSDNDIMTA